MNLFYFIIIVGISCFFATRLAVLKHNKVLGYNSKHIRILMKKIIEAKKPNK
jgi:hypothetical protein